MSVTGREKPPEVGRIIGACAAGNFSPLCAHASRYVESAKRRSEIRGGGVPERNIPGNGRRFVMNEWAALVSLAQLQWRSARAATWLILPVVICLSQRLSHACLSTSSSERNCGWLIKSVMVHWIESPDMDNCGNSRANTCVQAPTSRRRAFIRNKTSPAPAGNTGELWITQPIARSSHRRRILRMSALSTFDGTLCAYHGRHG